MHGKVWEFFIYAFHAILLCLVCDRAEIDTAFSQRFRHFPAMFSEGHLSPSGSHFIMFTTRAGHVTQGETTAPLPTIRVRVCREKKLYWFAPDLKGESADREISIRGAWLRSWEWTDRVLTDRVLIKQNKGQPTTQCSHAGSSFAAGLLPHCSLFLLTE